MQSTINDLDPFSNNLNILNRTEVGLEFNNYDSQIQSIIYDNMPSISH